MPDDLDLRDVHGLHEPDPRFRLELRRQVEAIVRGEAPAPTTDATDATEPNEEDLIMLTDTRTEPTDAPKRARRWLLPAAVVVLIAAVAAIAITASDDDDESSTVAGPSTPGADVAFHDDFSDDSHLWETSLPDVTVEGGHQVWTIPTPGQVEFLRPRLDAHDPLVDMEVTAQVASVDPDSTIGVYCRKGVANQDFYYYFRLGLTGATIGVLEAAEGGFAGALAEDPSFVRPDGPFEITARCTDVGGDARLELLVDGQAILEGTHEAPLPAGYGALEVHAGAPGSEPSDVRWDEFTVTAL